MVKVSKLTKEEENSEAIVRMREWLKPGDTVYTVTRKVSSSRMSRNISAIVFIDGLAENRRYLDWNLHLVFGYRDAPEGGVTVRGLGSDLGFELVYNLGRKLFPHGFGVVGKRKNGKPVCPSSPIEAKRLVAAGAVFCGRNGDASGWEKTADMLSSTNGFDHG